MASDSRKNDRLLGYRHNLRGGFSIQRFGPMISDQSADASHMKQDGGTAARRGGMRSAATFICLEQSVWSPDSRTLWLADVAVRVLI